MARAVPRLDLAPVHRSRGKGAVVEGDQSSTDVVYFTPETLESPFDVRPRKASPGYMKKLREMKEGEDYLVMYRLSPGGSLIKVIRRHAFGPVDLGHMSRYHQHPIPHKQKVHILDQSLDLKGDQKHSNSHRKNSFYPDLKESALMDRSFSSQSLMAAKQLLSTTLSLEYGPKHRKIRANSTVGEFVAYYQHRYQHKVFRPEETAGNQGTRERTNKGLENHESLKLKFVKTTKRLEGLLGQIKAQRSDVMTKMQKSHSVSILARSFHRVATSASKTFAAKKQSLTEFTPPEQAHFLTFSDVEETFPIDPQQATNPPQHMSGTSLVDRDKVRKHGGRVLRIAEKRKTSQQL